jgi:hypothetical protein
MARPKLTLRNRSDAELESYARSVFERLSSGGAVPGLQPDLATFGGVIAGYQTSRLEVSTMQTNLRAAFARKNGQRRHLETVLTQVASSLSAASLGSAHALVSAGIDTIDRGSPVGVLPAPLNFLAKPGDREGRINLRWKAMVRARLFEIQSQLEGSGDEWTNQRGSTRSRCFIDGFTPGQRYVFRVRAISTAGPGPWSDLAFCRAP